MNNEHPSLFPAIHSGVDRLRGHESPDAFSAK